MIPLLLALLLQAPQRDTLVVRVPMPEAQAAQARDTTPVKVDVHVTLNPTPLDSAVLAGQERLAQAIASCGCTKGGAPGWFYAGVLSVATGFLWRYWQITREADDDFQPEPAKPSEPEPGRPHRKRGDDHDRH